VGEYHKVYGLTDERLTRVRQQGVYVMHPGPVNRGVELTDNVMTYERSLINQQVENGIAVRMSVLYWLRPGAGAERFLAVEHVPGLNVSPLDYINGSSAGSEDKFAQLLWSQFDLALWFQRALWIAALVSVGDIAWEFHTGVADVYSKVSSYTANRATHPDAFQRLVSLEVYRTIGIVVVVHGSSSAAQICGSL